jgi:hypothetical protein
MKWNIKGCNWKTNQLRKRLKKINSYLKNKDKI